MSAQIKERPILFQGAMVRALLDGSKTQTRRALKSQPPEGCSIHYMLGNEPWLDKADRTPLRHHWEAWGGPLYRSRPDGYLCGVHTVKCPYGMPGDLLWVKEDWQALHKYNGTKIMEIPEVDHHWTNYPASGNTWDAKRRAARFMPRWASRILLEVVSVRVERLNDCSEADALAEGIDTERLAERQDSYDIVCAGTGAGGRATAQMMYRELWESINGAGSWAANPWVWCVTFRRINP